MKTEYDVKVPCVSNSRARSKEYLESREEAARIAAERNAEEESEMTYREKLQQEHPEKVKAHFDGGCKGCPNSYGYTEKGCPTGVSGCEECWDRKIGA